MSETIRVLNAVGRMGAGGMESLIMNIYRNIDRDLVQFDFISHNGNGGIYEDEIRDLGGRIYEMPVIRTFTKTYYWKFFKYVKALKQFFSEHPEYHVLHGHMSNTASIYMPIAKKYGEVTCCIAHSHLTQARPGMSGKVTDILHKPLPRIATDYFACSEMAARWIFPEELIHDGKVKIIKNGVDPREFRFDPFKRNTIRSELGVEGKYVLGNVGRFKEEKNQVFQVELFSELHKKCPETVLLLIGDGEKRAEVEQRISELQLMESVKLLGIRNDVKDLMQAMDLFVLPSLYEGLPVVGVEAQAAGLPVLSSTGVTREMDITGNVVFKDLEDGAESWAEEAYRIISTFDRNDTTEIIVKNGYDITETAKWLQNFYIQKHFER